MPPQKVAAEHVFWQVPLPLVSQAWPGGQLPPRLPQLTKPPHPSDTEPQTRVPHGEEIGTQTQDPFEHFFPLSQAAWFCQKPSAPHTWGIPELLHCEALPGLQLPVQPAEALQTYGHVCVGGMEQVPPLQLPPGWYTPDEQLASPQDVAGREQSGLDPPQ